MSKVKSITRENQYSTNYDVIMDNGLKLDHIRVSHTYKTFATAVVVITFDLDGPDSLCGLSKQQMDGIARRLDGRFRLAASGIEADYNSRFGFRRYTFKQ